MLTYTKLRNGGWGVRGPVEELKGRDGSRVIVTKRDGSTKEELIQKVVWDDGKVALAALAKVCKVCGRPERYGKYGRIDYGTRILRSGECGDCYEERKMGY